jgi:hypothetical protein
MKVSPMNSGYLSEKFRRYSQRFITGCAGFPAHCCRHIVATEWLKNHPGSYAVPASVLHDSEEMVKTTYDWCEQKDKAILWEHHLGGLLREAGAVGH